MDTQVIENIRHITVRNFISYQHQNLNWTYQIPNLSFIPDIMNVKSVITNCLTSSAILHIQSQTFNGDIIATFIEDNSYFPNSIFRVGFPINSISFNLSISDISQNDLRLIAPGVPNTTDASGNYTYFLYITLDLEFIQFGRKKNYV